MSDSDVLMLALDTQVRFLPYALGVFFIGLPLYVWAASYGLNPLSLTVTLALFAINWGIFYAALNWIRSPASKDLSARVMVQTACGLLWSGCLSLTALVASYAGDVAPVLLLICIAGVACLIFFSAPVLLSLLVTGPLAAITPLWLLYSAQDSHEWAHLAFSALCLVFAFAWILNRHLQQHYRLILDHEQARRNQDLALTNARALAEQKDAVLRTLSEAVRVNLNGLDGLLEAAEQSAVRAPSVRNTIHTAQAQLSIARITIESTLDQEEFRLGTLKPSMAEVNGRDVLNTAAAGFSQSARLKPGLDLIIKDLAPPDRVPVLKVDPAWLDQILSHLLRNAIDYTPEGHVTLLLREDDGDKGWMIEVSDSGPGLNPEELEEALKPYSRVDRISQGYRGAGLGLPLARGMTLAMGGTFDIISAPGLGTRVQIRLPGSVAALEEKMPDVCAMPSASVSKSRRILIVHADRVAALVLKDQLEGLGHKAMITPNRDRALRLLETVLFDAAIVTETDPDGATRGYRLLKDAKTMLCTPECGAFLPAPPMLQALAEVMAEAFASGAQESPAMSLGLMAPDSLDQDSAQLVPLKRTA